jgi:hypothetical protein
MADLNNSSSNTSRRGGANASRMCSGPDLKSNASRMCRKHLVPPVTSSAHRVFADFSCPEALGDGTLGVLRQHHSNRHLLLWVCDVPLPHGEPHPLPNMASVGCRSHYYLCLLQSAFCYGKGPWGEGCQCDGLFWPYSYSDCSFSNCHNFINLNIWQFLKLSQLGILVLKQVKA